MPIYSVQAPDGSILDIEGPEGASESQILQAAKAAFGAQQQSAEPASPPETTAAGIGGAITRGVGPYAAGAIAGGLAGSALLPVAGTAIGAGAGAAAVGLGKAVGDPAVRLVNSIFGTDIQEPTTALERLFDYIGVPQARSEAERVLQAASAGAGEAATGVGLGRAIAQTAQGPVAQGVGQLLAVAPKAQIIGGAGAAGASKFAEEQGAGVGGQLAAGVAGALAPVAGPALKAGIGGLAKAVAPTGAAIKDTAAPKIGEAAQSIRASIKEKLNPQEAAKIKQGLTQQPDSTEFVNYKLAGSQVVPDKQAAESISQGWKDGVIASVKAASDKDRQSMIKMLNIYELGKKSEKFRAVNRPSDVLGDSIQNRIEFLDRTRRDAGQMIDRVAKEQLKGARVNVSPVIDQFVADLAELNVKVEFDDKGVAKAVLQGSDIQGDKTAQRLLNNVLERLSTAQTPDAYGAHTAKRFIDTQVSYGKKQLANPLSAQAERVVKNLRRNLNQTLGDINSDYKAANTRYSDTTNALNDLQKSVGTNVNFDDENAAKSLGTAARKLTSNYASRANMLSALGQANDTAARYGAKFNDDIINQVIFANELDRMFGAAADTSLKGQMQQAAQTGLTAAKEAARGGGGLTERAINLAAAGLERARGINEENAIKVMRELLQRRSNIPSSSREVARFAGNR